MLTSIDFYKADHRSQYPQGTEYVYSNFTPRSNKYAQTDKVVVFGIQAYIMQRLISDFNAYFFHRQKSFAVETYKRRLDNALGKGAVSVEHIEALHDLGYLPIHIKALPEGVKVAPKIPVLTMVNTLPEFFWLTNYLETITSAELWMPMTSASIANRYREILAEAAEKTGTPAEFVAVQGHDFSFRGMPGLDAAAASGSGHLTSFIGTDTVPAIDRLEKFYGANSDLELIGVSVPATEHSVMCMGTMDDELGTFERLLDTYPVGIVSIVSDTWDFWKVMTEFAPALKDKIRARQPITDPDGNIIVPGKTVFRPDSGCPVKILTGYKVLDYDVDTHDTSFAGEPRVVLQEQARIQGYEAIKLNGKYWTVSGKKVTEAEVKGAVEVLWDTFGGSITDKGFKQLDDVGLIYGDSITLERAQQIVDRLADKGFASGNVVLGIGSFTYQYNTRDTYGFAMKATWGQVNGEAREIFKDPKTDDGTKKSARGLMRVELEDGEYVLYDQQTKEQEAQGQLQTVFKDGVQYNCTTLGEIRERVAKT